jgi:hypothetical protein
MFGYVVCALTEPATIVTASTTPLRTLRAGRGIYPFEME